LSETSAGQESERYSLQLKDLAERSMTRYKPGDPAYRMLVQYLSASFNNYGLALQEIHGDNKAALEHYRKSLDLANKINDSTRMAEAYSNIGYYFVIQDSNARALKYFSKSLDIWKKLANKKGMASSYNGIGHLYHDQGNMSLALDYLYNALRMREEIKDMEGVSNSLNDIGVIYAGQSDTAHALEYFQKSLKASENLNDKKLMTNNLDNLGTVYLSQGHLSKAMEYYQRAYKIRKENKHYRVGEANSFKNIGNVYMRQANYSEAISHLKSALKIYTEVNSTSDISYSLYSLACCYIRQKKYHEALHFAEEACRISKEKQLLQYDIFASDALSFIYEHTDNYPKAFEMLKRVYKLKDSLNEINSREENIRKKLQYDFDEKKHDLKIKREAEEKLKSVQYAQKEQNIIAGFIIFIVIILCVFSFIYYRYRFKKEEKEQTLRLEVKDAEIKALKAQMNPHFIFNSLNSVLEFMSTSHKQEALEYLSRFSKLVRMVLETSENKTTPLSKEIEILELYLDLENFRFGNNFSYDIRIDKSIDLDATEIDSLVIQPFIENALFHGLRNKIEISREKGESYQGRLTLNIVRENEHLRCVIEDNGIGREMAVQLKNARLYSHYSMGLRITNKRINLLNKKYHELAITDLTDAGNNPLGTRVDFIIPILENY
jgi:tetratricopeptide (TPR) repeat protein